MTLKLIAHRNGLDLEGSFVKIKIRTKEALRGVWGFREKGYLFSGIWGESITFWGCREQGAGENILGSWGERSCFFQEAKTPPPGGGLTNPPMHWNDL